MGQSTNAIIAFGFDLGEELPEKLSELMEEHESDTDDVLAEECGISLPQYAIGCDYTAYRESKDSALASIKINLIEHCSGDCPMYFLAARGSDHTAARGDPTALDVDAMNVKFEQEIEAMRAFCDRNGIEWQEPKWHIFSMWC